MSKFYTGNIMNSPTRPHQMNHIRDGIIEEIRRDNRNGMVTVSYGVLGDHNMIRVELITLIVSPTTIIQNQFGRRGNFNDLQVGMKVDASFSSRMTMSLPPQASAYIITYTEVETPFNVTTGQVLFVDPRNSFLITGKRNNIATQQRFNVTNQTIILDPRGRRIPLYAVRMGSRVRIEHATFQTASIPPQTTAYRIQVL